MMAEEHAPKLQPTRERADSLRRQRIGWNAHNGELSNLLVKKESGSGNHSP